MTVEEPTGGSRTEGPAAAAGSPRRPVRVAAAGQPEGERRPEAEPVPVLYIAGIGRSGSTLLARALGEVDGFVAAGEVMHFFGRGLARNEYCACGTPVRSCPAWGSVARRMETNRGSVPAASIEAFRERFTEGALFPAVFSPWRTEGFEEELSEVRSWLGALYRAVRAESGADVVVDSSKNAAYARILQGAPGVRVHLVHLVRDSRGVANSLRKRKRRPGTNDRSEEEYLDRRSPVSASLFWTAAQLLVEGISGDAEGYRRMRYRDFVRRPADSLRGIVDMVPPPEGTDGRRDLDHVAGDRLELTRQHFLSGNPVRAKTGTITLREDVSWREQLGPSVRTLVSGLTLPLLSRYGYSVD